MSPPLVYLDTSDYSRFGDVLRGKADKATEETFNALKARKRSGSVIFAASMPILGELLQYNADFRETTLKKAEVVQRLCGDYALAYPTRLLALEIAEAAQRLGLLAASVRTGVLSADRYWYPNVADSFDDLGVTLKQALDTEIAALPSRALRRRAAKQARKVDLEKAARDAAPTIAAKYELPVEAVTESIVAFLQGKITSAEASRRLFAHIAEPVSFGKIYFERIESDQALPRWMSDFGEEVQAALGDLREKVRPFMEMNIPQSRIQAKFADFARKLGWRMIGLAVDDAAEFGVSASLIERFSTEEALAAEVPACEIVGAVVESYVSKIIGLHGGAEAAIEHSFGGDLVHALYLPHVDLWRGDRRFAPILKKAMPRYTDRVVPRLKDLPTRIDTWQTAASC